MRTRHVSTVIRRPPEQVYDYARDPANLGTWAAGLASGQIAPGDGVGGDTLEVDSPMGRVSVRFLPRNELGVLDHEVTLPDGSVTYNPLRVVPHPEGAEVIFTLRGVDDDEFDQDAAMVAEDLDRLRALLDDPPASPAGTPAPPAVETEVCLATPADAGSLGGLLHDFNAEFDCPTPSAVEAAGRFERLLAREDVLAVVARIRDPDRDVAPGTDVGFALLTLRPTPYWDGPLAQLEELYVRADLRSGGIGTAILELATSEVLRRGGEEIHINVDSDDTGARRFYERHGYSDIDPDSGSGMRGYLRQL